MTSEIQLFRKTDMRDLNRVNNATLLSIGPIYYSFVICVLSVCSLCDVLLAYAGVNCHAIGSSINYTCYLFIFLLVLPNELNRIVTTAPLFTALPSCCVSSHVNLSN